MWLHSEERINMTEAIICGLIAAATSITVAMINNSATRKLIEYKITELQKEVEKHNSVVERTFDCERRLDVHDEKISNLEGKKSKS